MRTDVKLGVVVSAVIVSITGGYFFFRGDKNSPVPMSGVATVPDAVGKPASSPDGGDAEKVASPNQTAKTAAANRNAARQRDAATGDPGQKNGTPNKNATAERALTQSAAPVPVKSDGAIGAEIRQASGTGTASPPATAGVAGSTVTDAAKVAAQPAGTTAGSPDRPAAPGVVPGAPPTTGSDPRVGPQPAGMDVAANQQPKPTNVSGVAGVVGVPLPDPGRPVGQPSIGNAQSNAPPKPMTAANAVPGSDVRPIVTTPVGAAVDRNRSLIETPPSTGAAAPVGTAGRPAGMQSGIASEAKGSGAGLTSSDARTAETHRVQPGETFTSLAQAYYGDTKYTQHLIDHNSQIRDPNRLSPGMSVKIPPAPTGDSPKRPKVDDKTAAASPGSPRTYRVQAGDTFYAIARDQLGNSGRWRELVSLNKNLVGSNPTQLQVGQVLVLPQR